MFRVQLLVEFVQNASIPLGQSLEESDTKASCVQLLSSSQNALCGPLDLPGEPKPLHVHQMFIYPDICPSIGALYKRISFYILIKKTVLPVIFLYIYFIFILPFVYCLCIFISTAHI